MFAARRAGYAIYVQIGRFATLVTITLVLALGALVLAIPAAATGGGANQVVLASTTSDGAFSERSGLQFALVGGPTVGSENLAEATSANCTGCTTIAIAFQAVVATGNPSTVVPHNAAIAVNGNCTSCSTYAYAYQYVLTTTGAAYLSPGGTTRLTTFRAEVADLAASRLSFDELTARLDELAVEFRSVVDSNLVAVGDVSERAATRWIDMAPTG
jgi:putative peptide zinc metalloprotease protein